MIRKSSFFCAFVIASSVQAMPVEIELERLYEFNVGPEGVRLVVDLGHLEPGWYRLNENGLEDIIKATKLPATSDDSVALLRMWAGGENIKGQRFGHVSVAGNYKFAINLSSREHFLHENPVGMFDPSQWTNFGSAIDDQEFEGYPDCPFVNNIPSADQLQSILYTLEPVEERDVPQRARDLATASE